MNYFLFTNNTDIPNYADDNIPYTSKNTKCKVIERLEERSTGDMLTWFEINGMKANSENATTSTIPSVWTMQDSE